MKQSAIVVCPGRGTYNKTELGYLQKYHGDKTEIVGLIDQYRKTKGQRSVSELDGAEAYRPSVHNTGDNASPLIYACAVADFHSIDREAFEIVGITGNSMGWYLALACAGALSPRASIEVVNTMGRMMHREARGGQVIYPLVNEQWQPDPQLVAACDEAVANASSQPGVEIYTSICLAGMRVLAANDLGVKLLLEKLPPTQDRYPFALPNHGAFHSPLMEPIVVQAKLQLSVDLFETPNVPLIDGRGHIWQPYSTDIDALYEYTLGYQIAQTYNFSSSIEVAIKEFAPDKLIILGPGTTLGPPTAQALIQDRWLDLASKRDFADLQKNDPFLLSMGMEDQRARVVSQKPKPSIQ